MTGKDYHQDMQLNILVLGAMTDSPDTNNRNIGRAIEELFQEDDVAQLLKLSNTTETIVHVPDNFSDSMIVSGVLSKLDIADMVIVNLTPSDGINGTPSPNVYYELGLVHALGIPYILIAQKGSKKAFYTYMNKVYRVEDFDIETVKNTLRPHLLKFLNLDDRTDFSENEVSRYYDGMPIVDISAAVGLATGYFYNYVLRIIGKQGFVKLYPELMRKMIIVKPENVMNDYEDDMEFLKKTLKDNDMELLSAHLEDPNDGKKLGWFDRVDDIVIDMPRAIYTLKNSPRIIALQEKLDKPGNAMYPNPKRELYLRQVSNKLLTRVESVINFHKNKMSELVRKDTLYYSSIEDLPRLLKSLKDK